MRKLILSAAMLASVLTTGVPAPATAAPSGHDALAAIMAQTSVAEPGAVQTVQYGEYRRREAYRRRQERRRRHAARRHYRRY